MTWEIGRFNTDRYTSAKAKARSYGRTGVLYARKFGQNAQNYGLAYEYAQNKMAGVHVRRKLISRHTIWFDDHSALLSLWFVFQLDQSGGSVTSS